MSQYGYKNAWEVLIITLDTKHRCRQNILIAQAQHKDMFAITLAILCLTSVGVKASLILPRDIELDEKSRLHSLIHHEPVLFYLKLFMFVDNYNIMSSPRKAFVLNTIQTNIH